MSARVFGNQEELAVLSVHDRCVPSTSCRVEDRQVGVGVAAYGDYDFVEHELSCRLMIRP